MTYILGINELVAMERSYTKKGKVKMFGVGDMYNIADKIITTSYLEGFGLFFIESWFHKRSIIGRDLPQITSDFKSSGIKLEHMYSSLFIENVDFKDYGTLSERLKLVLRLRNPEFFEIINTENKQALSGLYSMFDKREERKLIRENNKVVKKVYSTKSVLKQMINVFRKTPSELILKE